MPPLFLQSFKTIQLKMNEYMLKISLESYDSQVYGKYFKTGGSDFLLLVLFHKKASILFFVCGVT